MTGVGQEGISWQSTPDMGTQHQQRKKRQEKRHEKEKWDQAFISADMFSARKCLSFSFPVMFLKNQPMLVVVTSDLSVTVQSL